MVIDNAELPLTGCRVLIVEDNLLMASSISAAIEEAGGEVIGPYASMIEAIDGLSDLIAMHGAVLDIGLGDEESYVLADALALTNTPFMFLTAVDKRALPERFARTRHMLKPFSDHKLIEALIEIGVSPL